MKNEDLIPGFPVLILLVQEDPTRRHIPMYTQDVELPNLLKTLRNVRNDAPKLFNIIVTKYDRCVSGDLSKIPSADEYYKLWK